MLKESSPPERAAARGYERRDINAGAVAGFGAGLAVVSVAIFFALRGLLGHFSRHYPEGAAAIRDQAPRTLPPEPRLQSNPAADLEQFREKENLLLNTYGWLDRPEGIARIPIERAMDIIAQRGGPATPAAAGQSLLRMRQRPAKATP